MRTYYLTTSTLYKRSAQADSTPLQPHSVLRCSISRETRIACTATYLWHEKHASVRLVAMCRAADYRASVGLGAMCRLPHVPGLQSISPGHRARCREGTSALLFTVVRKRFKTVSSKTTNYVRTQIKQRDHRGCVAVGCC